MNNRQKLYYGQAENVLNMILAAREWHHLISSSSHVTEEIIAKGQDLLATMLEYRPREVNRTTWKADVRNLSELMNVFNEMGRLDGLNQLANDWWGIFHPTYKKACGILRNRCTRSTDGGDCDYRFPNRNVTICPECDTPRSLCSGPPSATDGRCLTHSQSRLASPRTAIAAQRGRAEAYKMAMIPDLRGSYEEMMGDPGYLSLMGEIGLIGSRNTRLLQDMEDFDPIQSKTRIQTALAKIEGFVDKVRGGRVEEVDLAKVNAEMMSVRDALEDASNQERRWSEIKGNAKTMAALVDSERKLLVDLQMMITKPEVEMMNAQIVSAITSMATKTGASIEDSLLAWMGRRLSAEEFILFKQAVTAVNIAAKTKRLILTNIEEALRRGEQVRQIEDEYDTIEGHFVDE